MPEQSQDSPIPKLRQKSVYNKMEVEEKQVLSPPLTVVGMVNGMIGGLILLLPIYALESGYISTLIIIFLTGVFSYYSCYLCVLHMGDQPDLDYAVLRHFNGSRWAKIFYDVCVWLNLILIDLLYFQLIVTQWIGLIPPHQFSVINPIVNAIVLFILVFVLKYFEFGASIMAYGIISIIVYLLFLIWVVATYEQGNNATPYNAFGSGIVTLAASMGQAFSIQSFFIPVLKKNKYPQKYAFYTMLAYIIGGLAYYYIAYMGSIGIWHRTFIPSGDQDTIQQYFGAGTWQVNLIEAVYLIHLYSVFPEFMLISKKRIFGVFGVPQSQKKKVNIWEVGYFVLMVVVCFIVGFFEVDINDIIDINGAVIGFFFIYLIPATLHIKCLYFSKGKKKMPAIPQSQVEAQNQSRVEILVKPPRQSEIEIVQTSFRRDTKMQINQPQNNLYQALLNKEQQQKQNERLKSEPSVPKRTETNNSKDATTAVQANYEQFYCDCDIRDYSRKSIVFHWIIMIIMVLFGLLILINGIYTVAT